MAIKTFYVVKDMKHPLYKTRMLRAGDQLDLDGPSATLYRRLGVITDQKPVRARAKPAAPKAEPKPAAKKAPAKKRTTKRTAKK